MNVNIDACNMSVYSEEISFTCLDDISTPLALEMLTSLCVSKRIHVTKSGATLGWNSIAEVFVEKTESAVVIINTCCCLLLDSIMSRSSRRKMAFSKWIFLLHSGQRACSHRKAAS